MTASVTPIDRHPAYKASSTGAHYYAKEGVVWFRYPFEGLDKRLSPKEILGAYEFITPRVLRGNNFHDLKASLDKAVNEAAIQRGMK